MSALNLACTQTIAMSKISFPLSATMLATLSLLGITGPSVAQKSDLKSVSIYTQVWMSENLNVDRFRNGDAIPEVRSQAEWIKAGKEGKPAWCYYQNDPSNGARYGRLYNWHAVNDKRGLAPIGWHIATSAEWGLLKDTLGAGATTDKGRSISRRLRERTGWKSQEAGTDESGFAARPGGMRMERESFTKGGEAMGFWSRDEADFINKDKPSCRVITDTGTTYFWVEPTTGLSVRCVRDPNAWTTANLNVDRFRNGDPIPEAKTPAEWEKLGREGKPVWAYYNFDPANGEKYGRHYNWYAVNDPRGLAPKGWHIPSNAEWISLVNAYSGRNFAGGPLKSSSGWSNADGYNTNASGLGLLPGGYCNYQGLFRQMGAAAMFWTASQTQGIQASAWIFTDKSTTTASQSIPMLTGASVRCVKD
jgi:uncharacterized protein (TIGR02145 family)